MALYIHTYKYNYTYVLCTRPANQRNLLKGYYIRKYIRTYIGTNIHRYVCAIYIHTYIGIQGSTVLHLYVAFHRGWVGKGV